jgi:hypothetical protein
MRHERDFQRDARVGRWLLAAGRADVVCVYALRESRDAHLEFRSWRERLRDRGRFRFGPQQYSRGTAASFPVHRRSRRQALTTRGCGRVTPAVSDLRRSKSLSLFRDGIPSLGARSALTTLDMPQSCANRADGVRYASSSIGWPSADTPSAAAIVAERSWKKEQSCPPFWTNP